MDHHSLSLLHDIALGIIFATIASHVARVLRQPLILGYVLGGVLLGSQLGFGLVTDQASIQLISEIGLILLLFIIGLEINLRELARMGKAMFVLGVAQFVGCALLAMAFFRGFGYSVGGGNFDLLYIGVAFALSSTLIVVKLLHDKFEIGTVAGRLTVGILVLQDIWAILFMAFQPNLLDPALGRVALSFAQGGLLVAAAFLASRHLLSRLFQAAGKTPELVLLTSIAWCFAVCGFAQKAGLSKEMGALIAGMSIAAFPYGTDVIAKLAGIRDFFVTLFFVSLGLQVPMPTAASLGLAAVAVAFVVASRLLSVVPVTVVTRMGLRTGILTALNLSQISEFSLVILALGAGYKHISPELQSFVLTAMLLASVVSTYLILLNDRLARPLLKFAKKLGLAETAPADEGESHGHGDGRDIVLLGCFRAGLSLLGEIEQAAPELKSRVLVVDYNPALKEKLAARGFKWVYGDLAHPQTLEHLHVDKARLLICTISDTYLKGITNRRLVAHLKRLAPSAQLVMTADDSAEAEKIVAAGAHDAVVPAKLAGAYLFQRLSAAVAP